jgi:hypothetical protein
VPDLIPAERLTELGSFVVRWRAVWSHRPFIALPAPWERDHPEVARFLRSLDEDAVDRFDADPQALASGPGVLAEWCAQAMALCAVEASRHRPHRDELLAREVPARKREQVQALAAIVRGEGVIVDWCGGRSHLGRAIARSSRRSLWLVDRNESLCRDAVVRAEREGIECHALARDVLIDEVALPARAEWVALHSCGRLADRACEGALAADAAAIYLVSCCYHFQPNTTLVGPRSAIARGTGLELKPHELRFVTSEETAASPARRRRRRREQAFRLGLDLLLREASGRDEYTELRGLPCNWANGPFREFVTQARDRFELVLPAHWDAQTAEQRGWQRAREAAQLALVRAIFRRPVELWLVLDRARWLEERGYGVSIATFCPRAITPRNLLIRATR